MHDGLHSRLKALRSDSAEKIGLKPAPQNLLRALRPLRSTTCGEHETWRYALRLQADFFSRPAKSPPPGTACRDGQLLVFDVGCTSIAREPQ
jgi:hypothetical protein